MVAEFGTVARTVDTRPSSTPVTSTTRVESSPAE
jgi:hypothetical protein